MLLLLGCVPRRCYASRCRARRARWHDLDAQGPSLVDGATHVLVATIPVVATLGYTQGSQAILAVVGCLGSNALPSAPPATAHCPNDVGLGLAGPRLLEASSCVQRHIVIHECCEASTLSLTPQEQPCMS